MIENLMVKIMGDATSYLNATQMATRATEELGKRVTSIGTKLTAGVTLPMAVASAGFVKSAINFNEAMANVQSLGVPIERVKELKTGINDLSVTTAKSANDLAGGMYQVVSAFGDSADSMDILTTAAKASKAGLSTTEEAVNLLSAVTKGYGDTSAEAVKRVSDLSFQTVKLGQTDFKQLAGSIGRVTPLTAELGVKQEELFGVMATATGVTGKAAEVSTQFRGILQSLMVPTEDMNKLFKEQGVETGKDLLAQKGLADTIKLVVQAQKQSGKPLQDYISSIDGQVLALTLAGSQSEVFAEKLREMENASGATNAAFDAQTKGINAVGFSWEQAQARSAKLARQIGDMLLPIFEKFLTQAEKVGNFFASHYNPAMDNTIALMAGIAAGAGPILIGFGKLIPVIGTLISMFGGLGSIITALLSPWIAIPLLIGVAVAAVWAFGVSWKELQEIIINAMRLVVDVWIMSHRIMKRSIAILLGWITGKIERAFADGFVAAVKKATTIVKQFMEWIGESVYKVLQGKSIGSFDLKGDFNQARESGDLLGTISAMANEEFDKFKQTRAEERILPDREFSLRPEIQSALNSAKTIGGDVQQKMLEKLTEISGTNQEIANKEPEEAAVALGLAGA